MYHTESTKINKGESNENKTCVKMPKRMPIVGELNRAFIILQSDSPNIPKIFLYCENLMWVKIFNWVVIVYVKENISTNEHKRFISNVLLPRVKNFDTNGKSQYLNKIKEMWIKMCLLAGMKNFRKLNLENLHLKGLDFSGADFSGSNLNNTVFESCILENATFNCAKMFLGKFIGIKSSVNFYASNLWGSEFLNCDFTGSTFACANLPSVEIKDTILGANLWGAKFNNATFCNTSFGNSKFGRNNFYDVRF